MGHWAVLVYQSSHLVERGVGPRDFEKGCRWMLVLLGDQTPVVADLDVHSDESSPCFPVLRSLPLP